MRDAEIEAMVEKAGEPEPEPASIVAGNGPVAPPAQQPEAEDA
jgi:hypothetical protein